MVPAGLGAVLTAERHGEEAEAVRTPEAWRSLRKGPGRVWWHFRIIEEGPPRQEAYIFRESQGQQLPRVLRGGSRGTRIQPSMKKPGCGESFSSGGTGGLWNVRGKAEIASDYRWNLPQSYMDYRELKCSEKELVGRHSEPPLSPPESRNYISHGKGTFLTSGGSDVLSTRDGEFRAKRPV